MHGGASPGAPKGKANGNYRHGRFTNDAVQRRRAMKAWLRSVQEFAAEVE